jgi:diguanylate cyclase (GGDEF)-like protein
VTEVAPAPARQIDVLVADDSATVRRMVSEIVARWGFSALEVADGTTAWRHLQAPGAPRLALLDWEMPGMDGPELCRRLRDREALGASYTYVLLLTGRRDKLDLVAGMEAGADDYVTKPFDEHELRVRLRAGQRVVALQTELYRLKELFRLQSRTDPLTGTLNRRAMVERLAAELSRTRREGASLGVAMVDVDHFKRVNDTYGHAAGDAVLRELARRIEGTGRGSDAFGRIGGEEFVVVWPRADAVGSHVAAERLRRAVSRTPFVVAGAPPLAVTVSVGVTSSPGDEPTEAILARADEALYEAKRGGRDRVELAPPPRRAVRAADGLDDGARGPPQEPERSSAPAPSARPWLAMSE